MRAQKVADNYFDGIKKTSFIEGFIFFNNKKFTNEKQYFGGTCSG